MWKNQAKKHRHHERDRLGRCNQSKPNFYVQFGKIIRHRVDCWLSCHNQREPRVSLKEIATGTCHTVPHTVVAIVLEKTVSVGFWYPFLLENDRLVHMNSPQF